ncbi:thioredoxin domain-containing protein [Streptomyces sp. NA04227]|uniref:thioredoxin domain-containing protein n=1 Tax=Streptomyces sp. NA04227 TaxID=2742136 RepID=UPI0015902BD5|nr:thioredoxin domain-containing protein [Streptomyces sp. NA04227]QKW05974.1 thioredoxin domain-containing protein [Streptomyces sp. NA04227]
MSKRNSQAAKQAARERMRAERERQAKKDKMRRQLIVAGAIVGVLAASGGIGYAVVQSNKPGYWESAKDNPLVKPTNTSGENGTTVLLGKDSAKKTLKLYEDSRCPVCAQFEQQVGPEIDKDLADGKYRIQYIGATFIDKGAPGEGSRNALSALGAALNVGEDAFLDYKAQLYSAKFHPSEQDDKFKSDAYLLKVAEQVPELKGNAAFRKAVQAGTYDRWALEMSDTFTKNKDGVDGTPSLVMNGKKLTGDDNEHAPMTVPEFRKAVDAALKG